VQNIHGINSRQIHADTPIVDSLASLPAIHSLFRLIWRLFGLNVGLLSANGLCFIVSGKSGRANPFCAAVQRIPEARSACLNSDRSALAHVILTKTPTCYRCFAGLREFMLPISIDHKIAAVILSGQILDHPPTTRSWRRARIKLHQLGIPLNQIKPLKSLFMQSRSLSKARQRDVMMLLTLFTNQIMYLQSLRLKARPSQSLVERTKEFLQTHAEEHVTLAAVAQAIHVSARHLARTFKTATGNTMHDYLQELRLTQARDRLAHTQSTCAEIAFSCGFGSIQQFNRVFKKQTHQTPSAWRRRAQVSLKFPVYRFAMN